MLLELHIENFAIIKDLTITLSPGFNVLTGETGAGKSIIIDAVKLLLGDRASPEMIRTGEEEALIEGVFDISRNRRVKDRLKEMGLRGDETLLLRRRIGKGQRGRVYVNGNLATLSILSSVGEGLIAIYGQHEHQSLLKPGVHIDLLDSYGNLMELRRKVEERYKELSLLERELMDLKERERDRAMREEFLRFQIREIEGANLRVGEEEELKKERERLRHRETILKVTRKGHEDLYSKDGSVIESLSCLLREMEKASAFDESLQKVLESLKEALYIIEDVAIQLRDHSMALDISPERLDEVEERLARIGSLKKKYGGEVTDIIALKERMKKELKELEGREERIKELEERIDSIQKEVIALAEGFSSKRRRLARSFEEEIMEELSSLGMEGASFKVFFERCDLYEKGVDRVEFYLSPNKGESLRPLSKIASGGELSRIMLAVKMVSRSEDVPTLIFDEVDAGIGGRVADRVGKRLKILSKDHQILCVTHLPQVASYADHHYRVSKREEGGRTITEVDRLDGKGRVEELSRMLGGERVTEKIREHAQELLSKAYE